MIRVIRKIKNYSKKFINWRLGGFFRTIKKKEYPKNEDGKVLIHVGCGDCIDPRYINFDSRPGLNIHVADKIENIDKIFGSDYADLIYACHVIEHIPYADVLNTIKKMHKCLKEGGVLRISVPDFFVIVQMYRENEDVKDVVRPLLGGQGYEHNFHYAIFDYKYLKTILLDAGFKKVRKWNPESVEYYNFNDWAGKTINLYGKDYPISLNLEAVK